MINDLNLKTADRFSATLVGPYVIAMQEWKKVFLLSLAGVGFRILNCLLFANDIVADSDQLRTITLARKFASGNFYGVLDPYWPPLYPILIGILTYFVDSPILPALTISIITGSLAVPLTYYLVKQSYGQREATLAAVIAIFFPHLINSVFSFGTENIYLLLVIGALIIGWKGLKRDAVTDYLLTGILLGLAYLTRPEAIGYLVFFVLLALGKNLWRRKLFARNSTTQIGALLLGFGLLAAPYILYLRSATGAWTISAKAQVNSPLGELRQIEESETSAAISTTQTGKLFAKYVAHNLIEINKNFPFLVPPFLLIFVGLGLFSKQWDKERLRRETYLILFCLVTAMGYALTVVQARYFYVLLPIFFGWIASGIILLERWFDKSVQNWMPNKSFYSFNPKFFTILCVIFIYLYVLPINYFMVPEDKAWHSTAYEERDAGVWLKEHGKPSATIFSASSRPVFYAEGHHLPPTTTDMGEIFRQIKERRVDYVITGERSLKRNPYLKGFTETLQNDPEFELIYEKNEHPGYKIEIFRMK